jgi:D-alanine-D-alanine ligase
MMNIAIIAGGDSGEYEISMKSGRQVELQMDKSRYMPYLIHLKGDQWNVIHEGSEHPIDKNNFTINLAGRVVRFDAVFNAIHGTPGEDGKIQGYLDMLNIPYTSCGVTTSAMTFNKSFCKSVVSQLGVHTAPSIRLFKWQVYPENTIRRTISLPCFIKPNNGGSSVGMSKVTSAGQLPGALANAFREDDEVLVEEFVKGLELTCGVLRTRGEVVTLPVCEIVSKKEFFDYEAKYTEGMADEIVPAPVPDAVAEECRQISGMLYEELNCRGIVRFDYIFSRERFVFLEVNTVPGLTEASIVPKMVKAHGWSYTELVTRLIEEVIGEQGKKVNDE